MLTRAELNKSGRLGFALMQLSRKAASDPGTPESPDSGTLKFPRGPGGGGGAGIGGRL
jgi:hypothetical protein